MQKGGDPASELSSADRGLQVGSTPWNPQVNFPINGEHTSSKDSVYVRHTGLGRLRLTPHLKDAENYSNGKILGSLGEDFVTGRLAAKCI